MTNTPPARVPADRLAAASAEHTADAKANARNVSDRAKTARSRFVKLDGFAQKLSAKPLPGFHLCWVNDDGKVEAFLDRGYDFVENDEQGIPQASGDTGNRVRRLVGRKESGEGLYAYLMKIPQEWREEDLAREREQLSRVEQTIKRGGESRADAQAKQYTRDQRGSASTTADAVRVERNTSL